MPTSTAPTFRVEFGLQSLALSTPKSPKFVRVQVTAGGPALAVHAPGNTCVVVLDTAVQTVSMKAGPTGAMGVQVASPVTGPVVLGAGHVTYCQLGPVGLGTAVQLATNVVTTDCAGQPMIISKLPRLVPTAHTF